MTALVRMEKYYYKVERKNRILSIYSSIDRGEFLLDEDLGDDIMEVWRDKDVQETFLRSSGVHFIDSATYYLNAVSRISRKGYIPSDQDILRSRLPTTGIIETKFNLHGKDFRIFDVGGQRSERRKWIHVFDNVTAVIFTVSLSGYDETVKEDCTTNQMHESLQLFHSICHQKCFEKTSMLLFLNKKDIFEKKIAQSPLKNCFPEYTGEDTYDEASGYIRKKLLAEKKSQKEVYTHFTNATDSENVQFVFDASMSVVMRMNLREAGMG